MKRLPILSKLYENDEPLEPTEIDGYLDYSDVYWEELHKNHIDLKKSGINTTVMSYIDSGEDDDHKELRTYLNDGYDSSMANSEDYLVGMSNDLSEYISKNKITEDTVLYRRVRIGGHVHTELSGLGVGSTYTDKGFGSSSWQSLVDFGGYEIKILARKGSDIAPTPKFEEVEFLIDKNTEYKVLDKSGDTITLEII